MKKIILLLSLLISSNLYAALPDWAEDLNYYSIGSCETKNLTFNAARFSKFKLNQQRDGLDLYLQMILFFDQANQQVIVRTMEMGLVECQMTKDGNVCSFRPYNDTKKLLTKFYQVIDQKIVVDDFGEIIKVREDFPWLGYEFNSPIYGQSLGGKVQINFNHQDINVGRLCL